MDNADAFRRWFDTATDDMRETLWHEVTEELALQQMELPLPRDFRKADHDAVA